MAKISGDKFFLEAVAMFMIEAKSKSNKKIMFLRLDMFKLHEKLLVIFKFEQVVMKENSDH